MIHLIKLAVGVEDFDHIAASQLHRAALDPNGYGCAYTRNRPKRQEELLDGGYFHWVIKGYVAARQKIMAIEEHYPDLAPGEVVTDHRPEIIFKLAVPVERLERRAHRPFQGWRYLKPEDAPKPLSSQGLDQDQVQLPEDLENELQEMGFLTTEER